MVIEELKKELEKNGRVTFKLYTLSYIIEKNIAGDYSIFPTTLDFNFVNKY